MTELDVKIEIVQDEGIFKGHTDAISEQILFFPEHKRLVSCGDDMLFFIWDYETKLPILKYVGEDSINHCIIYDENTVLAVDGGGNLLMFDIPSAKLKKICKDFTDGDDDCGFILLLKLSEDLILLVCLGGYEHVTKCIIVSISSEKIVRYIKLGSDLSLGRISYGCRIMLSKSSKNTFFFNPGPFTGGCIREIDHEMNHLLRRFQNVDYNNFCSFLNRNNEEILVCFKTNIDVFKVSGSGPRVFVSKTIKSSLEFESFYSCVSFPIFNASHPDPSFSSFPQYLCLGDTAGSVSIRKFDDDCNFKEIAQFTIPECKKHPITCLGINEMKERKNEITIFASSEYLDEKGSISISIFALNVKNIDLPSKNHLEIIDVSERTDYLKTDFIELIREENHESLFLIGSFGEMFLYRSFF